MPACYVGPSSAACSVLTVLVLAALSPAGNYVTDFNSINPCYMHGDGDSIQFIVFNDPSCNPAGSSNDVPKTLVQHFICGANCGKMGHSLGSHHCNVMLHMTTQPFRLLAHCLSVRHVGGSRRGCIQVLWSSMAMKSHGTFGYA